MLVKINVLSEVANQRSVIDDQSTLILVTHQSEFIFVGRISEIILLRHKMLCKVRVRRTLKGDLGKVGIGVSDRKPRALRFSGASVFVESVGGDVKVHVGMSAVFLARTHGGDGTRLELVVPPVRFTLRALKKIDDTVQGK